MKRHGGSRVVRHTDASLLAETGPVAVLQKVRLAHNGYRSAVAAAQGYVSGQRVYNLRSAERELRTALWNGRDAIADMIRNLLPES